MKSANLSCNTTCIIAHQRWLALTSARSAKSPDFQRSRAPTSAWLISDKREVGSSSLPRPTDGNGVDPLRLDDLAWVLALCDTAFSHCSVRADP